jgi:hypothetical protein
MFTILAIQLVYNGLFFIGWSHCIDLKERMCEPFDISVVFNLY